MFPYSLGVTTLLQGFYTQLVLAILLDAGSPTLDLRTIPEMTAAELVLLLAALTVLAFPLGVMMHTLSRNMYRKLKDRWALEVLASASVIERFTEIGAGRPTPGAPTLEEIQETEGTRRVRKAGEFMHAINYAIMTRSAQLYRSLQVYRDQYQLARGFVIPSVALAVVLPFWGPVIAIEAGHFGPFPVIRSQLFMLPLLFALIAYRAFRERSYRYAAGQIRGYLTLEGKDKGG